MGCYPFTQSIRAGSVTGASVRAVQVERRFAHPLYGKQVAKTKKYQAHDEHNEFRVGDTVRMVETRPLSKTKRWRVAELIERPE